jgi:hypothetical protein
MDANRLPVIGSPPSKSLTSIAYAVKTWVGLDSNFGTHATIGYSAIRRSVAGV